MTKIHFHNESNIHTSSTKYEANNYMQWGSQFGFVNHLAPIVYFVLEVK